MRERRTATALSGVTLACLVLTAVATAHNWRDLYLATSPAELYQRDMIAWSFSRSVPEGAVRERIIEAAQEWSKVPNARLKFDYRPGSVGTTSTVERCGSQAEPPGHTRSVVYWQPFTPKHNFHGGLAVVCLNRTAGLDYFRIWFNSETHWSARRETVPASRTDVRSTATHEFGHATGWYLHLDEGSSVGREPDICQKGNRYRQTMCSYIYTGQGSLRSLGKHDKGPFSTAY